MSAKKGRFIGFPYLCVCFVVLLYGAGEDQSGSGENRPSSLLPSPYQESTHFFPLRLMLAVGFVGVL